MNDPQNKSDQSSVPQLFAGDPAELQTQRDAAAVARAVQEVQAALVIAQRFPRDEIKAKARIIEACKRKDLAEVAEYEYSRGGTRITGPSIDLILAVSNRWGNIRYGWTEVGRRDGQSEVRCFAWDLQSNGQAERTFFVRHWRDTQAGGYALEDERDIYEMLANQASRRVRACLEQVIDQDVVNAAVDQCRLTLKEGSKEPITDRVVKLLNWFIANQGVTKEMLETRLGNKLEAVSENQLASLVRIAKALKDGVGKREDYFKAATAAPAFGGEQGSTQQPATAGSDKGSEQSATLPGGSPPHSDEAAEAAAGLAPEQPKPTKAAKAPPADPGPQTAGQRLVKALRGLCKVGGIAEGSVLDFMSKIGLSDGSASSLEELAMTNQDGLQRVHDTWNEVSRRIKEDAK